MSGVGIVETMLAPGQYTFAELAAKIREFYGEDRLPLPARFYVEAFEKSPGRQVVKHMIGGACGVQALQPDERDRRDAVEHYGAKMRFHREATLDFLAGAIQRNFSCRGSGAEALQNRKYIAALRKKPLSPVRDFAAPCADFIMDNGLPVDVAGDDPRAVILDGKVFTFSDGIWFDVSADFSRVDSRSPYWYALRCLSAGRREGVSPLEILQRDYEMPTDSAVLTEYAAGRDDSGAEHERKSLGIDEARAVLGRNTAAAAFEPAFEDVCSAVNNPERMELIIPLLGHPFHLSDAAARKYGVAPGAILMGIADEMHRGHAGGFRGAEQKISDMKRFGTHPAFDSPAGSRRHPFFNSLQIAVLDSFCDGAAPGVLAMSSFEEACHSIRRGDRIAHWFVAAADDESGLSPGELRKMLDEAVTTTEKCLSAFRKESPGSGVSGGFSPEA